MHFLEKKEKWYDHKVSVKDPRPETGSGGEAAAAALHLEDGNYTPRLFWRAAPAKQLWKLPL